MLRLACQYVLSLRSIAVPAPTLEPTWRGRFRSTLKKTWLARDHPSNLCVMPNILRTE